MAGQILKAAVRLFATMTVAFTFLAAQPQGIAAFSGTIAGGDSDSAMTGTGPTSPQPAAKIPGSGNGPIAPTKGGTRTGGGGTVGGAGTRTGNGGTRTGATMTGNTVGGTATGGTVGGTATGGPDTLTGTDTTGNTVGGTATGDTVGGTATGGTVTGDTVGGTVTGGTVTGDTVGGTVTGGTVTGDTVGGTVTGDTVGGTVTGDADTGDEATGDEEDAVLGFENKPASVTPLIESNAQPGTTTTGGTVAGTQQQGVAVAGSQQGGAAAGLQSLPSTSVPAGSPLGALVALGGALYAITRRMRG